MIKCLLAFVVIGLVLTVQAQELPATKIRDIYSGKTVAFNDVCKEGEVTLISFWASWCIPGKRQIKTITRKITDWKKQADFNYIAIAVDQQHNEALARTYALSQNWSFPCYIDANSDLKPVLNFLALPYIMIIDRNGKVAFTHTGYDDGLLISGKLKEISGGRVR